MREHFVRWSPLPTDLIRFVATSSHTVLLETTKFTRENFRSFIFSDPVDIIQTDSLDSISTRLELIDEAVSKGCFAAGFVSYEAGYAFEPSLTPPQMPDVPLLWFGIYKKPFVFDHRNGAFVGKAPRLSGQGKEESPMEATRIRPSVDEMGYAQAIARIQKYIVEGDSYQVNYTFKLRTDFEGDIAGTYSRLRNAQHVCYGALIRLDHSSILSFSPELFFQKVGSRIVLRPMKGTAPRGRTLMEDNANVQQLTASEKNRSENLMIVDLLRNDVGKIANVGSVKVKKFFSVEKYDTVFQATSTIEAVLRPQTRTERIFRALFPSGSVTGAPKIRTMQIIRELEHEPRGVYTGAIGFVSPKQEAVFNVAIRTVVVDHRSKSAEMGIGSGIVHESSATDEYRECLLKAKFLTEEAKEFQLMETMLWEPSRGWFLLRQHLDRLMDSASYFDFTFDRAQILRALSKVDENFRKSRDPSIYRLRLLLHRDGRVELSYSELEPVSDPQFAAVASHAVHSGDRFLFHKTTHRELYDRALAQAERLGLYDFIFVNEKGELTEGARSNLLIKKNGVYCTPPVACGVLPGVYRSQLFTQKGIDIEERILHVNDLAGADEIILCNSVRGMVKVRLKELNQKAEENSDAQLLAVED